MSLVERLVLKPLGDNPPKARLLYGQDARESLRLIEADSVQVLCTSPPYYGLRDYGGTPSLWGGDPECDHEWGNVGPAHHKGQVEQTKWKTAEAAGKGQTAGSGQFCVKCDCWRGQLGLEPTPLLFVEHLVEIFDEVRRVLRPDGVVWLNLGDSYAGSGKGGWDWVDKTKPRTPQGFKPKDLMGIPWRAAFALQDAGWWLRNDIVWCLSGDAWVYARINGDARPYLVEHLASLNPSTTQLWNGQKWTQLLGVSASPPSGDEIEIVLRSGERITCTPNHEWPTDRGLIKASDLVLGDVLETTTLPEPEHPLDTAHIGQDAAWFVGLFLANGSWIRDPAWPILIKGPVGDERWARVKIIAHNYGGSWQIRDDGIKIHGGVLVALLKRFLFKSQHLKDVVWQYSDNFLDSLLKGFLPGGAHKNPYHPVWRFHFSRNYKLDCLNYKLDYNLRALNARLGYSLTLKTNSDGERTGELRRSPKEAPWAEILEIQRAQCAPGTQVFDIGVADDPHLFALASGVLTHNSKGNPMPESVRDRCARSHEYVFLLTKSPKYFFDSHAIKEQTATGGQALPSWGGRKRDPNLQTSSPPLRNKRTVWGVNSKPYKGAHFAVWPEALVEPMVKAGSSEHGCCSKCRAPYQRRLEVVGRAQMKWGKNKQATVDARLSTMTGGTKNDMGATQLIKETVGWDATCDCVNADVVPCIVLDIFSGSGTTGAVAMRLGRDYIGTDLQQNYVDLAEARLTAQKAPAGSSGPGPEPDLISGLFGGIDT